MLNNANAAARPGKTMGLAPLEATMCRARWFLLFIFQMPRLYIYDMMVLFIMGQLRLVGLQLAQPASSHM